MTATLGGSALQKPDTGVWDGVRPTLTMSIQTGAGAAAGVPGCWEALARPWEVGAAGPQLSPRAPPSEIQPTSVGRGLPGTRT